MIDYLDEDQIFEIFQTHRSSLNIELVILAMPESAKLAQTFIRLGIPHVIGFNFDYFMKYTRMIPKIYEFIYQFCLKFY